jgi:hypothetical protein
MNNNIATNKNANVPNINPKSTMITTPAIYTGSQNAPPDPIDKVIKMMLIEKEADREKQKLKEKICEIEAAEHCSEKRQQRKENRAFMQMLMMNMVNNNNNNNYSRDPPTAPYTYNNFNTQKTFHLILYFTIQKRNSIYWNQMAKQFFPLLTLLTIALQSRLPRKNVLKDQKVIIDVDLSHDKSLLEKMILNSPSAKEQGASEAPNELVTENIVTQDNKDDFVNNLHQV